MARGLAEGLEKGIAEGMEKGETKAKIETARMMKAKRFSVADIADITGLTKKEIEKM